MDATRVSDGKVVALKKISKKVHPYEAELTQFFSSEPHSSSPKNHCIPLYDELQVPDDDDCIILAIPHCRRYNDPEFETVGEVVEFFRQISEV
jgi:hypothetical protein